MKTSSIRRTLTVTALGLTALLSLSACSTPSATQELASTVKQEIAQVNTFVKLIPADKTAKVAVLTKQKNGSTGQYVGCAADKVQYVTGKIVFTKNLNGVTFVAGLKSNLDGQGYTTSWYNDKATNIKKLIADKDGYEYWFAPATFDKVTANTPTKTAVTVLGFGKCVAAPKTTSTPSPSTSK